MSQSQRNILRIDSGVVLALGVQRALRLPVEVLPDLTKPTVTILTEDRERLEADVGEITVLRPGRKRRR